MSTSSPDQATQSHPPIQEHNAETETPAGQILQQKCQKPTQSQDWKTSLCTTDTKHKELDTRAHYRKTGPKNI